MKKPISVINIQREIRASKYGINSCTHVRIYRGQAGVDFEGKWHSTAPDWSDGRPISNASVIRAKRAQLALLEQAQQHEMEQAH